MAHPHRPRPSGPAARVDRVARACTSDRVGGPLLAVVAVVALVATGFAACASTATTSTEPVATSPSHASDPVALARDAESRYPPDFAAAVMNYRRHLETAPEDRGARIRMLRCCVALGWLADAGTELALVGATTGSDPERELQLALLEFQLGHRDRAARRANEILAGSPPSARAWYLAGCLSMADGRWDEAETRLRAALDRDYDHAMAWCNLGATMLRQERDMQRRFGEALEARTRGDQLGRAIEGWMYPSRRWVQECIRFCDDWLRLACILRREGGNATADDALYAGRLAYFYGSFEDGIYAFERAFTLDPRLRTQMGDGWGFEFVKLHACELRRLRRAGEAWQDASARTRKVLEEELVRARAPSLNPHLDPLRWRWLRRVADDPDLFECHAIAMTGAEGEGRAWSELLARVGAMVAAPALAQRLEREYRTRSQ